MSILDWLFGKTRATKRKATSIFGRLFKRGVSKKEAQTRALFEAEPPADAWRKLSPKELAAAGLSPKSKRYTTTAKGGKIIASATISEKAMRNKRALAETGSTLRGSEGPTRLAAGQRPYKTAHSEQTTARARVARQSKRSDNFADRAFIHTFIDADGRQASAEFDGRSLAIMQEYRNDVEIARMNGDGAGLTKYRHAEIHDTSGRRIYVSSDLTQIERAENAMTPLQRENLNAERFYQRIGVFKRAA